MNKRSAQLNTEGTVDWLIAAILAVLVVATRLPFRTAMLYNWDSANFALGIRYFDVRVHAPHPPGYFFYVAVANLINQIVGEANASLVILSILFSVGAVIATYFLGKNMFGWRAGLIASLLLIFSVTFWTYGELALAYPSLALFSSLTALFAWRIITGNGPQAGLAVLLSIVYVVASGFRPDLLLFLGPLWLWCLWLQSWKTRIVCVLAAVAGFSLWYVPTALLSGGFAQYHAVLLAYVGTDVADRYSSTNKGLAGLIVNLRDTASYVFYTLYAAALPLIGGVAWLLVRRKTWLQGTQLRMILFFLVWVTPMVAFYTIIHIGDPGYVFTFLPAIMVLL
ncbi:MAG: glycosyltransferase family 39 protein, partial [Dehalococcoidia bacterium]|nr:glycosyltransferase family 39 protein [Dehalococcoidia bacterium]